MPQVISSSQAASLLAAEVSALVDAGVSTPIVLIDGRAASGKSTLAAALQNELFRSLEVAPRVVHMDDLYLGWDGLQAGSDYLNRYVLGRLPASWQEFDWSLNRRERWREFAGGTPLIVEGCGSLSRVASSLAHVRVWLSVDQEVRRARWTARDGHKFDEQWPIWAAQEEEFYAREKSEELADFVVV